VVLDASCFVQTNSGSTGSGAPVSSMTATLPTATTAGNALLFIVGSSVQGAFPTDGTFLATASNSSGPTVQSAVRGTPGGETSWGVTIFTTPDIGWWWIAEIDGLASMATYVDPFFNTHIIGLDYEIGTFTSCNSTGATTASTTCDTINSPPSAATSNGDDLIIVVGSAVKSSGAVPALTSCTDVGAGQPGTLTQIGSTIATTRAAGSNMSASIFYRLSGGTRGISFNARFTWASAVTSATSLMTVLKADWVQPQGTPGRAATNSMM
jgi:hypothetical protein